MFNIASLQKNQIAQDYKDENVSFPWYDTYLIQRILGNNKVPVCESRDFVHKKTKVCKIVHLRFLLV